MRVYQPIGMLIISCLALTSCTTVQKNLPTTVWRQARVRNEGYSLLYKLMSQESDVAKVLIIKHTSKPIGELIREIDQMADDAKKQLDQFHAQDSHLSFEMPNLPQLEVKTREAIEKTETKQLLFSSGPVFEQRLLLSQAQALNYAAHLAKMLQEQEAHAQRKQFLSELSPRCTALHDRVLDLLK